MSCTFTLKNELSIEIPCVFMFKDECMSCETWNQSIKDAIACVEMIKLYVIDSVLQCDLLSSILYAFNLHDS